MGKHSARGDPKPQDQPRLMWRVGVTRPPEGFPTRRAYKQERKAKKLKRQQFLRGLKKEFGGKRHIPHYAGLSIFPHRNV